MGSWSNLAKMGNPPSSGGKPPKKAAGGMGSFELFKKKQQQKEERVKKWQMCKNGKCVLCVKIKLEKY